MRLLDLAWGPLSLPFAIPIRCYHTCARSELFSGWGLGQEKLTLQVDSLHLTIFGVGRYPTLSPCTHVWLLLLRRWLAFDEMRETLPNSLAISFGTLCKCFLATSETIYTFFNWWRIAKDEKSSPRNLQSLGLCTKLFLVVETFIPTLVSKGGGPAGECLQRFLMYFLKVVKNTTFPAKLLKKPHCSTPFIKVS